MSPGPHDGRDDRGRLAPTQASCPTAPAWWFIGRWRHRDLDRLPPWLASAGPTFVLLEQGQLSSGTTWHAAGLLGQLRATESRDSAGAVFGRLYGELEAETGLATGLQACGGVTVARHARIVWSNSGARGHGRGLRLSKCELLTRRRPRSATQFWRSAICSRPLAAGRLHRQSGRRDGVTGRGARMRGVRIAERTRVTDIVTSEGRVTGVVTERGSMEAQVV